MAESILLVKPGAVAANPENPRLIFRQDELDALQESISHQGILVPLTVYKDGRTFRLLDGERRWRCAIKLGLETVPVIVQPRPDKMTNLMMMFAIHHRRKDWDPLPTALKLEELEQLFTKRHERKPTERELAEIASLTVGEVRRLKKLLGLPESYRTELLSELEKPRSQQVLTVDHVVEATTAAAALRKKDIIGPHDEDRLRKAILQKYRSGVVGNTVAPRKLTKIAQAVGRSELPVERASKVVARLISEPSYSIEDAFSQSVAQADYEHGVEQSARRLIGQLIEHQSRGYAASPSLDAALRELSKAIRSVLKG